MGFTTTNSTLLSGLSFKSYNGQMDKNVDFSGTNYYFHRKDWLHSSCCHSKRNEQELLNSSGFVKIFAKDW